MSHICGYPLDSGGPCRHPVLPPAEYCWQHRAAPTIIRLDAPLAADAHSLWEYRGCVLRAVPGPRLVECEVHGRDVWAVAESLGAQPPCDVARNDLQRELLTPGAGPHILVPLADYLRRQISPSMKTTAGAVALPFFEGQQISTQQLRAWGAGNKPETIDNVIWMEQHGQDVRAWGPLQTSLGRKRTLAEAGIDPIRLHATIRAMWPLFHDTWWKNGKPATIKIAVMNLEPEQWERLAEAGRTVAMRRAHLFSNVYIVRAIVDACQRGMQPQDFKRLLPHMIEPNRLRSDLTGALVQMVLERWQPSSG